MKIEEVKKLVELNKTMTPDPWLYEQEITDNGPRYTFHLGMGKTIVCSDVDTAEFVMLARRFANALQLSKKQEQPSVMG